MTDARPKWSPAISLGNIVSPILTVLGLGIPALVWAGRVDTRVETLAASMISVRSEVADIKATGNTTATALVGINYTISEGLKQTMSDLGRRVVSLEQRADKQADELTRLQIELATIRKASEAPGRRP